MKYASLALALFSLTAGAVTVPDTTSWPNCMRAAITDHITSLGITDASIAFSQSPSVSWGPYSRGNFYGVSTSPDNSARQSLSGTAMVVLQRPYVRPEGERAGHYVKVCTLFPVNDFSVNVVLFRLEVDGATVNVVRGLNDPLPPTRPDRY